MSRLEYESVCSSEPLVRLDFRAAQIRPRGDIGIDYPVMLQQLTPPRLPRSEGKARCQSTRTLEN